MEIKRVFKSVMRVWLALAVFGTMWGLLPGAVRADGPTEITPQVTEWSGEMVILPAGGGIEFQDGVEVTVKGDTTIRLKDGTAGEGRVKVGKLIVDIDANAANGATLTLGEGVTLTAAGMNIGDTGSGTLTVEGPGTLNVNGTVFGNVILKDATVVVKGGNGTLAANVPDDNQGVKGDVTVGSGKVSIIGGRGTYNNNTGIGSTGIKGNLTVNGGEVNVAGGALLSNSDLTGPGGKGVAGNVTFNGGKLTITGGAGKGDGEANGVAIADGGKLTNAFAGTGWTDIAGTGSGTAIGTGTNQNLESHNYKKVEFLSQMHEITASVAGEGTVTLPNPANECVGVYVTFTAKPAANCKIAGLTVTGADGRSVPIREISKATDVEKSYTFIMPDQNVTVAASFVGKGSFLGSGSPDDPYQIWDNEDWDLLANKVNGNGYDVNDFSGKFFKLTRDLKILTNDSGFVAGDVTGSAHPFKGTFDGNGKTLTLRSPVNYSSQYPPFGYLEGGTIKNLKIAGKIQAGIGSNNDRCLSSLVHTANGSTVIENCISTVELEETTAGSGDIDRIGAFVGRLKNVETNTLTFKNCVFNGKVTTKLQYMASGGFLGNFTFGSVILEDCLFAPESLPAQIYDTCRPFVVPGHPTESSIRLTNCFYTKPMGTGQGVQVQENAPASGIYKQVTAVDGKNYYAFIQVSGIEEQYLSTGNPIHPEPVVKGINGETLTKNRDYTLNWSDDSKTGTYTVTVIGAAGNGYGGSQTLSYQVVDQYHGYCGNSSVNDGKNLIWTYDAKNTKTLTISKNPDATGQTDFSMPGSQGLVPLYPWNKKVENIGLQKAVRFPDVKKVIVEEGGTSIGLQAFQGFITLAVKS